MLLEDAKKKLLNGYERDNDNMKTSDEVGESDNRRGVIQEHTQEE